MIDFKITQEHEWLQRLVGEWTFEAEVTGPPGEPPLKTKGKETVRMLGANWMIAEGVGEMPCPEAEAPQVGYTCLTIGYSPEKKAIIGTWIGSMMNHMWVYEGSLDLDQGAVILNTRGPKMDGTGMTDYRETLTLVDDNERIFSSGIKDENGEWQIFMNAVYKRV